MKDINMMILEPDAETSETLEIWTGKLVNLDTDSFIRSISKVTFWKYEELETLMPLVPLINKIEGLLLASKSNLDLNQLDAFLTFSLIIIKPAASKSLYSSFSVLTELLTVPSWKILKKVLLLMNLLLDGEKGIQEQGSKTIDFSLLSIFLCGISKNDSSLTLKKVYESVPDDTGIHEVFLKYKETEIYYKQLCGLAMETNHDEEAKKDLFCCRLLAIQTLLSFNRVKVFYQMCKDSGQYFWVFLGLEEMVKSNLHPEIATECIKLIGKALKLIDKEFVPDRLNIQIEELMKTWSFLLLDILKDIGNDCGSYPDNDSFLLESIELIPYISRYAAKYLKSEWPNFTIFIIKMIEKSLNKPRSESVIINLLKSLNLLIKQNIKYFRDNDGILVLVQLLEKTINTEINTFSSVRPPNKLLKSTLKFFKILIDRWGDIYGDFDDITQVVLENRLIERFTDIFNSQIYTYYEEVLSIVLEIIQHTFFHEQNRQMQDMITALLKSLGDNFPTSIKQANILVKFFCIIPTENLEILAIIENNRILSKIIHIIGTSNILVQSGQMFITMVENLQELLITSHECRSQILEGAINLLKYLKLQSNEANFMIKVFNIGNFLCPLLNNIHDIQRKFLESRGLELVFEIFHLKVKPNGLNNEMYRLNMFLKAIPDNLVQNVFRLVVAEIENLLELIFSFISQQEPEHLKADFYDNLIAVDCFVDALKTIIYRSVCNSSTHKDLCDLLVKLATVQRFLIKKQAEKLMFPENPSSTLNINPDMSVLESQENKTEEENWLFMCQLSIRKLFRSFTKIPNIRGKQDVVIDYCLNIGKLFGSILNTSLRYIQYSESDHYYFNALLLSDFIKVLFNEQNPSPLFLFGFLVSDGAQSLLLSLKSLEARSAYLASPSYHQANSIQVIWSLFGKLLENLISEKFLSNNTNSSILKSFGFSSNKDLMKKMREIVISYLKELRFLQSGQHSISFAKSVLTVLNFLTCKNKDVSAVDSNCLNMLVSMGFNTNIARQALAAVRTNSVESATEWIFAHPELMNLPSDDSNSDLVFNEELFAHIINSISVVPCLSGMIAECLSQICVNNESLSLGLVVKLCKNVGQIVFMFGGYSGLADEDSNIENVSLELLDAYMNVLQIVGQKNGTAFNWLKQNKFVLHGFKILGEAPGDRLRDKWSYYLLVLIDYIGKSGQESSEEIIRLLSCLLSYHNESLVFNASQLNILLSIVSNFVYSVEHVQMFIDNKGMKELLLLRWPKENCDLISQNKTWGKLITRFLKDPLTLFFCFQAKALNKAKKNPKLKEILKNSQKEMTRSKEVFGEAVKSVFDFKKKNGEIVACVKKEIESRSFPAWDSLMVFCESLAQIFYYDVKRKKKYILNTNNLVEFIIVALENCPMLNEKLCYCKFSLYLPYKDANQASSFLEHLLRTIIPYRYTFDLPSMSYLIPGTDSPLPQATYDHWIAINVKLLNQLVLHQVKKTFKSNLRSPEVHQECPESFLSNLVISLLSETTSPSWYLNPYSENISNIIPAVITEILLIPCPSDSKSLCKCVNLANSLSSGLIHQLISSFKSADFAYIHRNLTKNILRFLELLLRYNLNVVLQDNKNQELLRSSDFILFKEHFLNSSENSEIIQAPESSGGGLDETSNMFGEFSGDDTQMSARISDRGNERELIESQVPQPTGRIFPGSIFDLNMNRSFIVRHDEEEIMNILNNRNRALISPQKLPERPVSRVFKDFQSEIQQFLEETSLNLQEAEIPSPKQDEVEPAREAPEIDPNFLSALPEDIRQEVLLLHQREEPSEESSFIRNNLDTAGFVYSLSPSLRRDVLATANEDVINLLPPELVDEAYNIQERIRIRPGKPSPAEASKNGPVGYDVLSKIETNELSEGLYKVDPEALSSMFSGFIEEKINNKLFGLILLCLSAKKANLEHISRNLVNLIIKNNSEKNSKVTEQAIDILLFLAKHNKLVKVDLLYQNFEEFQQIIHLINHDLFKSRPLYLSVLLKLVFRILKLIEHPNLFLSQSALFALTNTLQFENLHPKALTRIAKILNVLSQNPEIKESLLSELQSSLVSISQEIQFHLLKAAHFTEISKESQVFRLSEVIKNISGSCPIIEFLWNPLSDYISKLSHTQEDQTMQKLLPLVQAMLVCQSSQELSKPLLYFAQTCSDHLNRVVRSSPGLLEGSLSLLISQFSFLLNFENKRMYFNSKLKDQKRERAHGSLRLNVRRTDVFTDSFNQLKGKSPEEMQNKLRVQFAKEDGIDAGGLAREWFGLLSREMFNPNYALFIPSPNGATFQPNSMSHVNQDHLQFFKFVGRIVGKAVCDGYTLDVYFTRSFYKHILGQEISYHDMEDIDLGFYKNLKSLVDINLSEDDLHEYYFSFEEQEFGSVTVKDLVPNGSSIRVNENNKVEYIKLLCHMKMTKNIQAQIEAFKAGFYEMIPHSLISIFTSKELELLIAGLPTFDIEDLKKNTEYHNYSKDSNVIVWFWAALEEFSQEERAEFLQFVTGSSKVPIEGFKALPGMDGPQKFQIHKCFASKERLPTAHTCINQLDLPEYSSEEELRNKLILAIKEGNEGFGFA